MRELPQLLEVELSIQLYVMLLRVLRSTMIQIQRPLLC